MKPAPNKPTLRAQLLQQRRAYVQNLSIAEKQRAGEALKNNVLQEIQPHPHSVITGFWPLADEIDSKPLLQALSQKHSLGLPVVNPQQRLLEFRRWTPETPLAIGHRKITVPESPALDALPDIMLIPGIAFDPFGHRLGFGMGHYDHTLEVLRQKKQVFAIGLGYDRQIIEKIPFDPWDQMLDCIITDQRTLRRTNR